MILGIPFLYEKEEAFVIICAPLMKYAKFKTDDVVYKIGDQMDEIYFIVNGIATFYAT